MTRSELIAWIAPHFPQLTTKDAELAVKAILERMSEALAQGNRIGIRGFGSFVLNYRPPRNGRNPKTGLVVQVPARWLPYFRPGSDYDIDWSAASDLQDRAK